ncbi:low specificity L-threonine aldolase [Flavobacterium sp. 5]|uniref:threonine aldolase family protein n=1 Tax=Flavobacterium sp. 5 TaxID=2035199 RepID=UPI000C2CC41C|nr:aminotransferase class I/II-fold pyridoxal phosphate-dependent enzyme [Flavobacterium sp. 5]PKB15214.1 L-threonine aldolase [Flavobacterium sp. 5]
MYNFKNDYSVGAHPNILNKLIETNLVPQLGYGDDEYNTEAKQILKKKISNPKAEIFFLSGGTQTNLIAISFLLRVHEAVISAKTGHISANETGAIEATGHKVIAVETSNGKLKPADIQTTLDEYGLKPHVVKPRLVYISNSTEIGTIYTKTELESLYIFCQQHNLLLYLDGARLGHALMAENSDLSLSDISKLTDVFYIGATKNGALLGEAIVFNKPEMATEFEFSLKQKGAMLAKGRLLAIQFLELFKDDLYFSLAKHANEMAMKIANAISENGFSFLTNSTTNQIFPILPNEIIDELSKKYLFYVWKKVDENQSAIRLITSWATNENEVNEFIKDINQTNN